MSTNKVSIKRIAELSGVSVATVSRVINNNGRFSEETRRRVLQVMKENDYGMNYVAKSLRMNKSYTIGVLVPDISNAFFSAVVKKIETYLYTNGYSVIICNTDRNVQKETTYLRILEGKMVDGLLVISGDQAFDPGIIQTCAPVVYIDRKPRDGKNVAFISSDHCCGGFLATEALILRGCKHIALVTSHENLYSSRERLAGYKKALFQYHLSYDPNFLIHVDGAHTTTKRATEKMLDFLHNAQTCDGIFAINDRLAIGAMQAVKLIAAKIPEDVKIIGFDNDPISLYCSPPLSSVKQDVEQLAYSSSSLLIRLMNGEKLTAADAYHLLPVSIVHRGTT
ncbi:MAG: LacI family DNA-binding transcriptional regulator [Sporolactobacillus sp.]